MWIWRPQTPFQPTLPARGATASASAHTTPTTISTHAPRTGSDVEFADDARRVAPFQPTLPARGATLALRFASSRCSISTHAPRTGSDTDPDGESYETNHISTHAPRTGSDDYVRRETIELVISTHAPRTGSDDKMIAASSALMHFNPRSPHGERPAVSPRRILSMQFQPTLPARGATGRVTTFPQSGQVFQPTLPARGATDDIGSI